MLLGMYMIIALAFFVYPDDVGAGAAIWNVFARVS